MQRDASRGARTICHCAVREGKEVAVAALAVELVVVRVVDGVVLAVGLEVLLAIHSSTFPQALQHRSVQVLPNRSLLGQEKLVTGKLKEKEVAHVARVELWVVVLVVLSVVGANSCCPRCSFEFPLVAGHSDARRQIKQPNQNTGSRHRSGNSSRQAPLQAAQGYGEPSVALGSSGFKRSKLRYQTKKSGLLLGLKRCEMYAQYAQQAE